MWISILLFYVSHQYGRNSPILSLPQVRYLYMEDLQMLFLKTSDTCIQTAFRHSVKKIFLQYNYLKKTKTVIHCPYQQTSAEQSNTPRQNDLV